MDDQEFEDANEQIDEADISGDDIELQDLSDLGKIEPVVGDDIPDDLENEMAEKYKEDLEDRNNRQGLYNSDDDSTALEEAGEDDLGDEDADSAMGLDDDSGSEIEAAEIEPAE